MLRSTTRNTLRLATRYTKVSSSIIRHTLPTVFGSSTGGSGIRFASQLAHVKTPPNLQNEPVKNFSFKDTKDWDLLRASITKFTDEGALKVPLVVGGKKIYRDEIKTQVNPAKHSQVLADVSQATPEDIIAAIDAAKAAKAKWATTSWTDRAAIFLKAADLISTKYRYDMLAATMLGQGKNIYQAEIDCVAELIDFFKFNVKYAEEMYQQQPIQTSPGVWNRGRFCLCCYSIQFHCHCCQFGWSSCFNG